MKVYLLTKGSYSDYRVCGAFLDEKLADEFYEKLDEYQCDYQLESYDIWDAPPEPRLRHHIDLRIPEAPEPSERTDMLWPWSYGYEDADNPPEVRINPNRFDNNIYVYANGPDREQLRKVVADHVAELNAFLQGLADPTSAIAAVMRNHPENIPEG